MERRHKGHTWCSRPDSLVTNIETYTLTESTKYWTVHKMCPQLLKTLHSKEIKKKVCTKYGIKSILNALSLLEPPRDSRYQSQVGGEYFWLILSSCFAQNMLQLLPLNITNKYKTLADNLDEGLNQGKHMNSKIPSNWFKNFIYIVLSSNCEMEVREGVKKMINSRT